MFPYIWGTGTSHHGPDGEMPTVRQRMMDHVCMIAETLGYMSATPCHTY
jgi:hypothetical protein